MNKMRFLSLLMVAVMAVALAACGGDSGTGGGGGTSNANLSNAELLKKAAANMKTLTSYHIDLTGKSAGQDIAMGGDLDLTSKNMNMTMSAMGMNIGVVVIGADSYISSDGGKTFTKSDSSTGASMTSGLDSITKMWDSFDAAKIDAVKDGLKDGSPATEKIDGVDTKHITGNAKDLGALAAGAGGGSTTMDGNIDIWVSTGDLPTVRQMKVSGTSSGQAVDATVKWTKINEKFDIKAPATSN